MAQIKLRRLSEFEWASVAGYIAYLTTAAGLHEINSNHITGFSLGRLGAAKLLKRKETVLRRLGQNKRSLEVFVGHHRASLNDDELAVLRTMYFQFKDGEEVVKGHIEFIGECVVELELNLINNARDYEGDDDDLQF